MQTMRIHFGTFLMVAMIAFVALPLFVRGIRLESDAQCTPVDPTCPCGMDLNPEYPQKQPQCIAGANKFQCPCIDKTSGKTTKGTCQLDQRCKGETSEGQDGKSSEISPETLSKLGEAIKGIRDALKGGGGGKDSPPPPPPGGGSPDGASRCGAFASFSSLLPSQFSSNATSGSLVGGNSNNTLGANNQDPSCNNNPFSSSALNDNVAGQLLNTLNSGNISDSLLQNPSNSGAQILSNLNNNRNLNTTPNTNKDSLPIPLPFTLTNTLLGNRNGQGPQVGFSGDLKIVPKGATLIFAIQNGGGTVAGFYGGNTLGATPPESIITNWCKDRPWATNFLAKIIEPTFFDGLCKWRGYQVGIPDEVPVTQNRKSAVAPKPRPPVVQATTTSTVTAKVAIWAVPAVVPIGARTSIYWNTQGVTGCKETSPDGSFSQASVSGGAATVPLTAATTFTISCLTASSTPITDYVTVQIGK